MDRLTDWGKSPIAWTMFFADDVVVVVAAAAAAAAAVSMQGEQVQVEETLDRWRYALGRGFLNH